MQLLTGLILSIFIFSTQIYAEDVQLSWAKVYGSDDFDAAAEVMVSNSGDLYVTGITYGDLNGTNHGLNDFYLAKFSADGSFLWIKQYGTSNEEYVEAATIDDNGNIYLAGITNGNLDGAHPDGDWDIFIAKYTSSGDVLWIKQIHNQDGGSLAADDIVTDTNGNIYLAGSTQGNLDGNHPDVGDLPDTYYAKFSSDGTLLFVHQIESESYHERKISIDLSNNLYISYTNNNNILFSKLNSDGTLEWTEQIYHDSTELAGKDIVIDSNDNLYILGWIYPYYIDGEEYGNKMFIEKYDLNRTKKSHIEFDGRNAAISLNLDNEDNLYLIGYTGHEDGTIGDNTSAGKSDTFLIKIDSNSSVQWIRQYGTEEDDYPSSIAIDQNNNIYIAGVEAHENNQFSEAFILKYVPINYRSHDFNADQISDIFWRHDNGNYWIMFMNSDGTMASSVYGYGMVATWEVRDIADFNKDGVSDILWQNTDSGRYAIAFMNSDGNRASFKTGSAVSSGWKLEGTGDFNNDQTPDILWRHDNGNYWIMFMNSDGTMASSVYGYGMVATWEVRDIADFNKDGVSDILWRNTDSGRYAIAFMNDDGSRASFKTGSAVSSGWKLEGTGDFNNDQTPDILWRHDNGNYWIMFMNSDGTMASSVYGYGMVPTWEVRDIADFNKDGVSDILWRNTDSGRYAIAFMNSDGSRASFKTGSAVSSGWNIME